MRELVFEDKWMTSIINRISGLQNTATQSIVNTISELQDRYEVTLPEIESDIDIYRAAVKGYLAEMGFNL